jgi:hypothetical protein
LTARAGAAIGTRAAGSRPLTDGMRWMFGAFAALAFVAGIQLFVLSEHTDRLFSWTIAPPLTAAFLGASYWAAFVLLIWGATRRDWTDARAAIPPVLVIALLLLVATIVHFEKFHHDLFGRFWLCAYVVVPPLLAVLVLAQLRVPGWAGGGLRRPLPAPLRIGLAAQAAVMMAVGTALFVSPAGADSLLPWTLTPLTARAVGAFVLGFGIAAAHAALENDLPRFTGAALAYLALGVLQLVAVARYGGDLHGSSAHRWGYVAFLATVAAAGLYGSARSLAAASASSASGRS